MMAKKDAPDSYEYTRLHKLAGQVGWGNPYRSPSETEEDIARFDSILDAQYNPCAEIEHLKRIARGETT